MSDKLQTKIKDCFEKVLAIKHYVAAVFDPQNSVYTFIQLKTEYSQSLLEILENSKSKTVSGVELVTMKELSTSLDRIEASLLASIEKFFEQLKAYSVTPQVELANVDHQQQIVSKTSSDNTGNQIVHTESTDLKDTNKSETTASRISKPTKFILEEWIKLNIEDPYPSHEQKLLLCNKTGVTHKQITNWFINRRSKSNAQKQIRQTSNSYRAIQG